MVPCDTQFQITADPDDEEKAQAAINTYFKDNEIGKKFVCLLFDYSRLN